MLGKKWRTSFTIAAYSASRTRFNTFDHVLIRFFKIFYGSNKFFVFLGNGGKSYGPKETEIFLKSALHIKIDDAIYKMQKIKLWSEFAKQFLGL